MSRRGKTSMLLPLVTPQGLEPQLTEPESVVLPITPWGNGGLWAFARS